MRVLGTREQLHTQALRQRPAPHRRDQGDILRTRSPSDRDVHGNRLTDTVGDRRNAAPRIRLLRHEPLLLHIRTGEAGSGQGERVLRHVTVHRRFHLPAAPGRGTHMDVRRRTCGDGSGHRHPHMGNARVRPSPDRGGVVPGPMWPSRKTYNQMQVSRFHGHPRQIPADTRRLHSGGDRRGHSGDRPLHRPGPGRLVLLCRSDPVDRRIRRCGAGGRYREVHNAGSELLRDRGGPVRHRYRERDSP